MKFRGQDPLPYRLATVVPDREFTDETPVGDLVIRVSHRLDPLAGGRLRVTYAARVDGPAEQAREVGPMITADFPETMAALIALAARDDQAPNTEAGMTAYLGLRRRPAAEPGLPALARHPVLAAADARRAGPA